MRFAYRQYEVAPTPSLPDGILYRPEIPVRVIGRAGSELLLALADTGADLTLLPLSTADKVQAKINKAKRWRVAGIGDSEIEIELGEVKLQIGTGKWSIDWRAKVGFVAFPNAAVEFAVLGHVGFFDHVTAHFNTRRRQLTVNACRSRRS